MKKSIVFLLVCFITNAVFAQTFMHGAGVVIFVGSAKGEDVSLAEGFTYSPRVNVVETDAMSVSVGIPLSVAVSSSFSTNSYYEEDVSIGLVVNVPLIVNLSMGRGSTKDNTDKFGYFVGAGFGYHHGDFLVEDSYYDEVLSNSTNSFGPAANAGVRFGVGRAHKNIEVRLSYMKGLNENKPNVFGVASLFNF